MTTRNPDAVTIDPKDMNDEQLIQSFADEVEYCVLDNKPVITAIATPIQSEIHRRLAQPAPTVPAAVDRSVIEQAFDKGFKEHMGYSSSLAIRRSVVGAVMDALAQAGEER